ncbi:allantoinase AllB [Nocardioides sp. TRM66260-LWL]|uniref:allantoinase AllB n=1 Tax=Nocardioides sp. TRM66260-LWL TaxID=2874478 RepID=UPI001CC380C7|nr:allantoinase AllB [Nocardioides sp. TRM66260-LWL]MBZ5734657.1 allantoinase AllB [Nocardioides sp. TRM66260-LWL]
MTPGDALPGGPLDVVAGPRVLVADDAAPDRVRSVPALLRLAEGRIAAIEEHPDVRSLDAALEAERARGATVLRAPDAAAVLPGGVDTHVHVNEPGRTHWEGFSSATAAAALGGVTTLVDMPLNSLPPTTTAAHLAVKRDAAAGQLAVDVGFWGGAIPGNLADLEPLWEAGVLGFKCFLSPSGVEEFPPLDAAGLRAALVEVARLGALLIVHAEDAAVLARTPAPPSRAYADFLASRPEDAELAAIAAVVEGVRETGARAHVLHLSSARALPLLAEARAEGLPLTVETCPHYLCLSAEGIPDAAPQFKCCPPIRDDANRDALWDGLVDGVIDLVVSDHSPADAAEKERGDGDLQQAWGGVSGLQVGLTAVAAEARARGLGLEQVSRWTSRNPADLVGLTSKGRLAVGADADLAVFDEAVPWSVDVARLAHRHPISAYDGLVYPGSVTATVRAGVLLPREPDALPRDGSRLARPRQEARA